MKDIDRTTIKRNNFSGVIGGRASCGLRDNGRNEAPD